MWSEKHSALAYIVRREKLSNDWAVVIDSDNEAKTVAHITTLTPSTHFRTFAWSGDLVLFFIDGLDLYRVDRGAAAVRIGRSILQQVDARRSPTKSLSARTLAIDPSDRLLAISIGDSTGVFRRNGTLVRLASGHLMGWSGVAGVLTEGFKGNTPTLYRYPLKQSGKGTVVQTFFKLTVVTDPAGRWFAYPQPISHELVFRTADGKVLRRYRPTFEPVVLAAVSASGRIAGPTGSY
jgi:hypothetical protein